MIQEPHNPSDPSLWGVIRNITFKTVAPKEERDANKCCESRQTFMAGNTKGPEHGTMVSSIRVSHIDGQDGLYVFIYYAAPRRNGAFEEVFWKLLPFSDMASIEFDTKAGRDA